MPRGDRTGPNGQGPRSGKGLGKCGSKRNIVPAPNLENTSQDGNRGNRQNANNRSGRGQGLGQGSGRGNSQN